MLSLRRVAATKSISQNAQAHNPPNGPGPFSDLIRDHAGMTREIGLKKLQMRYRCSRNTGRRENLRGCARLQGVGGVWQKAIGEEY